MGRILHQLLVSCIYLSLCIIIYKEKKKKDDVKLFPDLTSKSLDKHRTHLLCCLILDQFYADKTADWSLDVLGRALFLQSESCKNVSTLFESLTPSN